MSKADEMLRVYHAFNEEYFKVGQLVEVTIRIHTGMSSVRKYGYIAEVTKDRLKIVRVTAEGTIDDTYIVPGDLLQKEFDTEIKIIN